MIKINSMPLLLDIILHLHKLVLLFYSICVDLGKVLLMPDNDGVHFNLDKGFDANLYMDGIYLGAHVWTSSPLPVLSSKTAEQKMLPPLILIMHIAQMR